LVNSPWCRLSIVGLGFVLASCGGHDSGVAPLPVAPSSPSSGASGSGYAMSSSRGIAPEGFELRMKLDPRPGEDGIIRDGSPVTVDIDLCGSTPDAGKTLHFLFDLDFNDLAEVVGTGDTCHQKHTYRVPKDATKDVVLESNVCVTNGDPGVHDGSTYFSCRVVRVALPKGPSGSCGSNPGLPAGCQSGIYDGDPFSIGWPGGTGPNNEVPGFDGTGCDDEDFISFADGVVFAKSQAEAECLCGEQASGPSDTDFSGYGVFFCGPPPSLQGLAAQPRWGGR
jgi:hypothetical protein